MDAVDDRVIWEHAKSQHLTIVTKDEDFPLLTIHAHPTLSETLCFAAEMAEGTITDLLPPRKR